MCGYTSNILMRFCGQTKGRFSVISCLSMYAHSSQTYISNHMSKMSGFWLCFPIVLENIVACEKVRSTENVQSNANAFLMQFRNSACLSNFQTKQLSISEHSKFAWPTCLFSFFTNWIPFEINGQNVKFHRAKVNVTFNKFNEQKKWSSKWKHGFLQTC